MFFYTRKLAQNKIEVKLNSSYILAPDHELFGFVETLVPLIQNKNELSVFPKQFQIWLYSSLEMKLANKQQQMCAICIEPIIRKHIIEEQLQQSSSKDGYSLKCKHVFHKGCLQEYINKNTWFNCPKCARIYGVMLGEMPDGIMNCSINPQLRCPGYEQYSTIVIKYEMMGGEINKQKYPSAEFQAFLPNNHDGQQIAKMMQQCFRRKLTFIIKKNEYNILGIHLSGIPHKTSINKSKHDSNGYPDQQYLNQAQKYMIGLGVNM